MVCAKQECLFDVAHECGMADADATEGVTMDEGNDVAGKAPVAALKLDDWCARVVYAYGKAPG